MPRYYEDYRKDWTKSIYWYGYDVDSTPIKENNNLSLSEKKARVKPLIKQFTEQILYSKRFNDVLELLFQSLNLPKKLDKTDAIGMIAMLFNDFKNTIHLNNWLDTIKNSQSVYSIPEINDRQQEGTKWNKTETSNHLDNYLDFADNHTFKEALYYYTLNQDFMSNVLINEGSKDKNIKPVYGKLYSQAHSLFNTLATLVPTYSQRTFVKYRDNAILNPFLIDPIYKREGSIYFSQSNEFNEKYGIYELNPYIDEYKGMVEPIKEMIMEEFIMNLKNYSLNVYRNLDKDNKKFYNSMIKEIFNEGE